MKNSVQYKLIVCFNYGINAFNYDDSFSFRLKSIGTFKEVVLK